MWGSLPHYLQFDDSSDSKKFETNKRMEGKAIEVYFKKINTETQ